MEYSDKCILDKASEMRRVVIPLDVYSTHKSGVVDVAFDFFLKAKPLLQQIGRDFIEGFSRFSFKGKEEVVWKLKVRDVYCELVFFLYAMVVKNLILKEGFVPMVSDENKILKALLEKKCARLLPFLYSHVDERFFERFKRTLKNLYFSINKRKYFQIGSNSLLDSFKDKIGVNPNILNFIPKSYLVGMKEIPKRQNELSDGIISYFDSFCNNYGIRLEELELKYLRRVVKYHISSAFYDIGFAFSKVKKWYTLITGTSGKYVTRLLSYYFKREGASVLRFDHGGERSFFEDKWWGISEFIFLDEFVTFGNGHIKCIQKHIRNGSYLLLEKGFHINSVRDNSYWEINLRYKGKIPRGKKVMIVLPALLRERVLIGYGCPDVMALAVIVKVIRIFKERGFYVILKKHPKSPFTFMGNLFNGIVDEIDSGAFVESLLKADYFVFFYAGTAFCEALFSMKPIMLIDMGFRDWDEEVKDKLSDVCMIVDFDKITHRNIDEFLKIGYEEYKSKREEFLNNFFRD